MSAALRPGLTAGELWATPHVRATVNAFARYVAEGGPEAFPAGYDFWPFEHALGPARRALDIAKTAYLYFEVGMR